MRKRDIVILKTSHKVANAKQKKPIEFLIVWNALGLGTKL